MLPMCSTVLELEQVARPPSRPCFGSTQKNFDERHGAASPTFHEFSILHTFRTNHVNPELTSTNDTNGRQTISTACILVGDQTTFCCSVNHYSYDEAVSANQGGPSYVTVSSSFDS
jgi:hypothetical protein